MMGIITKLEQLINKLVKFIQELRMIFKHSGYSS